MALTNNTGEVPSHLLAGWFDTALGKYLLGREMAYFEAAIADIFGFHALQIGLPAHDFLRGSRIAARHVLDLDEPAHLYADPAYLPFAENSMDLVVLPHLLEFTDNPHAILREAYRVLRPEGQMVLSGFNPFSLWGIKRYFGREQAQPWNGNFVGLYRMKDWLSLLGFEVIGGKLDCYVPPCSAEKWLTRCHFFEAAGDRWWPIGGGVYFLQAVKRMAGLRLITPAWQQRARQKKAFAAVARKAPRLQSEAMPEPAEASRARVR
ncbi:MAG: class I SAM-dependent methyltransferase [Betaproteobacteria bacterium]|nr:class I SAM-dependent methyltransferase [Betaproteobacteria bacterium]